MKYTLKLKQQGYAKYSLYKGTTLVSDTDLGTLFASAGRAFFDFDFDSKTPNNTNSFYIVNGEDTVVKAVESKPSGFVSEYANYEGAWAAGSTAGFASFEKLSGVAMDKAEISDLMGKIKEGKIRTVTTADYNWPTDGTPTRFDPTYIGSGIYLLGESMVLRPQSTNDGAGTILIVAWRGSSNQSVVKVSADMANAILYNVDNSHIWSISGSMQPVDNLTNNDAWRPLSANQGKVLKDLIDSLIIKNAGAPTTATVGTVGMLYEDTTNGKLYQCTAVSGSTYTWVEVGGGTSYTAGTGIDITGTTISADTTVLATQSDLPTTMTGASSSTAGASGLVPAPAAGDEDKLLKGDGTWGTVSVPTVNDSTITITNNGTTVDSFTTNAASNKTIALAAPTITMTSTDPGEGAALAANSFIGVYN